MKRTSWVAACALALLTAACLVPKSDYDAEVARNRALVVERNEREAQIKRLQQRLRDLEKTGQTLELERASLDEERVTLINSLEELRIGNEELSTELGEEREVRAKREAEIQDISGTYTRLVEELEKEVESGQLEIHRLKGRLQVRALDKILFDSGSTAIKSEGRTVLARIARELEKIPGHSVRIEGHTDDVPIATQRFPSNWELSSARAVTVLRFLIESGLSASKVSASGHGEYRPIAANDNSKNRARNRRIEIVLVPEGEE